MSKPRSGPLVFWSGVSLARPGRREKWPFRRKPWRSWRRRVFNSRWRGRLLMSAWCRFEILRPLRFSDGAAVPRKLIAETLEELEIRFDAATWETQILHGSWRHEGKTHRDELVRVFVDAEGSRANRAFFKAYKQKL